MSRAETFSPDLLTSVWRSQVAAIVASIVDFLVLVFCVEVFGFWYRIGTVIGAVLGAVTNFLLGRYWSFRAAHSPIRRQVLRYSVVFFASLLLNYGGVVFFTESFGLPYWISKIITSFAVGVMNFALQRTFVFEPHRQRSRAHLRIVPKSRMDSPTQRRP